MARRDEQPPQPGYAATLLGDDAKQIMGPLQLVATAMTLQSLQNLTLAIGPALESPLFAPKALEATMTSPVLGMARNSIAGPMTSPLLGGPKMGTPGKLF